MTEQRRATRQQRYGAGIRQNGRICSIGIPRRRILFGLILLVILLPFTVTVDLHAQGFQIVNDRNHPYLDWQVAETEHFRIVYPDHLAGIENLAAPIAEKSYRELSGQLEVNFDRKIRIYLSDEDEINNGFAVPIGTGHTNIWVALNDYADTWTGGRKWLEKVIPHELAHIFHFQAIRSPLGLLNYVTADPLPRFWTEGLAQYLTEDWDSQRGDRWLRLAIFDSRPDYNRRDWYYNRRLQYAVGHSQVRYLTHTRGDSLLPKILSYRTASLRQHDFYRAFQSETELSWSDFREEWRKHMNIYYNTLASQMERTDSLGVEPEELPGRYFLDAAWSPDGERAAVLAIPSLQRPARQLFLVDMEDRASVEVIAEGAVRPDLSWSPDSGRLAWSRVNRDRQGSLVNDLYIYDIGEGIEERLTEGRRAAWPVFSRDGMMLAAVVNDSGTANLVLIEPETGEEEYLTDYEGDVQIIHLVWNHARDEFIYHRFDAAGNRHLVIRSRDGHAVRVLDSDQGEVDNRRPLVSPDGERIAFTSLRDEVPNIFVTDLSNGQTRRVTALFTGGEGFDWFRLKDGEERIAVRGGERKQSEQIYLVSPDRYAEDPSDEVPPAYADWRTHSPSLEYSARVEPDEDQILNRTGYSSWREITHASTFGLPWYGGRSAYGLAGLSSWVEPLGKHAVMAGGAFSLAEPNQSAGFFSYLNNQWYPSALVSIFRGPFPYRTYGESLLVERRTGVDLTLRWPINRLEVPFTRSWVIAGLRLDRREPWFYHGRDPDPLLAAPGSGTGLAMRVGWTLRRQKPFYRNLIHPIDGYGLRVFLQGRESLSGDGSASIRSDLHGYVTLPSIGAHRFMLQGRFLRQWGTPPVQDYPGFSRRDEVRLPLPAGLRSLFGVAHDRVRGYRSFLLSDRLIFLSGEYRIPFLPSLQTELLGLVRLGTTSLVAFTDAGFTGSIRLTDSDQPDRIMVGLGGELKNMVRIGPFHLVHSIGVAQPRDELFDRNVELYYRIQAAVPF